MNIVELLAELMAHDVLRDEESLKLQLVNDAFNEIKGISIVVVGDDNQGKNVLIEFDT